ncbi:MAG TPA: hypothetical protein VG735_11590, partial [Caulobacterales bacterium]|nr:hypothetical protein [Caulobacterales bacterium]
QALSFLMTSASPFMACSPSRCRKEAFGRQPASVNPLKLFAIASLLRVVRRMRSAISGRQRQHCGLVPQAA